ncbi:SDR family oxidoreductase [Enterococcus gilvus]|uniref:SDR family oxidoreductase n=1 Tax=Enterococcus gilvus TaxID=160453 RepID=UPI003D6B82F3
MIDNQVWFVTGASRGSGYELVSLLLKEGKSVVATSRNKNTLVEIFGSENEKFLPVELTLTDENDIKEVLHKTLQKFDRIDVLVNNAGFMRAGAIEDTPDAEVRECFDVNVFGTLNMCRQVVPIMRNQRSGYIINTSSIAGIYSGAFEGIYSGTKFAINGISRALSDELKPFGIHVTSIMPGFIRTEFLTPNSLKINYDRTKNSPYEDIYTERVKIISQMDGKQPGDPKKLAKTLVELSEMKNPPKELMLGSDAIEIAKQVYSEKIKEYEQNESLSVSIDF